MAIAGSDDKSPLQSGGAFDRVTLYPARVLKVILEDSELDENFEKYGTWGSVGGIIFEFAEFPTKGKFSPPFAYPLFSNFKHIPVENEIVSILTTNGASLTEGNLNSNTYYFLPPVNIWSSNHHNAVPDSLFSDVGKPPTTIKSTQLVEEGSTKRIPYEQTKINFGGGFEESQYVRPLQPVAGDIITEGRWGNSIRLSATNRASSNPWSLNSSQPGQPITIIRNGQADANQLGWIPIYENINQDSSSIYLTSTQQIDVETPTWSDASFLTNAPTVPNQYEGGQIILSSDRILLSSKKDHIVLTSNNSIHLSSATFNVDANEIVLSSSSKIKLGTVDDAFLQKAVKGQELKTQLDNIIRALQALTLACQNSSTPSGPDASLVTYATAFKQIVDSLNTTTMLSEEVFLS